MTEFNRRQFVVGRIHRLLACDPARLTPSAGAQLAQLRRALGKPPGSVPDVWGTTLDGIPDTVTGAAREREELAIHLALTHFAAHQQSRRTSMHAEQRPFASAVRALAEEQMGGSERGVHDAPAYRRLIALASTSHLPTAVAHALGLIHQLRAAEIAFDYGRYTDNLYWLQVPGQATRVQRGWGRDFHRLYTTTQTPDEGDDA